MPYTNATLPYALHSWVTVALNGINDQGRPLVAAKYMPILWTKFLIGGPWRAGRRAVVKALENTLERGGWTYLDLYQVRTFRENRVLILGDSRRVVPFLRDLQVSAFMRGAGVPAITKASQTRAKGVFSSGTGKAQAGISILYRWLIYVDSR